MKIVISSNYYNHHQASLSRELHTLTNGSFLFIENFKMGKEREALGYHFDAPEYVVRSYTGDRDREFSKKAIEEADIAITGRTPKDFLTYRLKNKKIIFKYSERLFKKKCSKTALLLKCIKLRFKNRGQKNTYMLCASAYTSSDYRKAGLYKNRCYKWGYFPESKEYVIDSLMQGKNKKKILWCGRFIDWKHPDDVITVAKKLKNDGYDFHIDFIGNGVMEPELKTEVETAGLSEYISFLGPMRPNQVREHMEKAGIYLFTSDRQEGWGAVLNESMNSGCAVVASHAIGSVPYLIDDTQNGYIYTSGNTDMLCEKVKKLLDDPTEQERIGKNAYTTIMTEWNASVAAERFVTLSSRIAEGEKYPDLYKSGPCSKA